MPRTSQKAIDRRINEAYGESCSGIQIDIMDTVKVFAVGKQLVEQGVTDDELRAGIRAYVETIRKN